LLTLLELPVTLLKDVITLFDGLIPLLKHLVLPLKRVLFRGQLLLQPGHHRQQASGR
jgi:hypothetical protein